MIKLSELRKNGTTEDYIPILEKKGSIIVNEEFLVIIEKRAGIYNGERISYSQILLKSEEIKEIIVYESLDMIAKMAKFMKGELTRLEQVGLEGFIPIFENNGRIMINEKFLFTIDERVGIYNRERISYSQILLKSERIAEIAVCESPNKIFEILEK